MCRFKQKNLTFLSLLCKSEENLSTKVALVTKGLKQRNKTKLDFKAVLPTESIRFAFGSKILLTRIRILP